MNTSSTAALTDEVPASSARMRMCPNSVAKRRKGGIFKIVNGKGPIGTNSRSASLPVPCVQLEEKRAGTGSKMNQRRDRTWSSVAPRMSWLFRPSVLIVASTLLAAGAAALKGCGEILRFAKERVM